jgi:hypothetical protein
MAMHVTSAHNASLRTHPQPALRATSLEKAAMVTGEKEDQNAAEAERRRRTRRPQQPDKRLANSRAIVACSAVGIR